MTNNSRKINSHNEWDPVKEIIVGRPDTRATGVSALFPGGDGWPQRGPGGGSHPQADWFRRVKTKVGGCGG